MSKFWDRLSAKHKESLRNGIKGFRRTVATRYFTDKNNDNEEYIKSIARYVKNIDMSDSMFGNPVAVKINSHMVSQDLINSMFEIEAMPIDFSKIESVCEVGAGYGRTAYVLLKRYPHLKYTIIDIPPALDLAREHLTREFPDADITFLPAPHKSQKADLYIAISVLTELSQEELTDYFEMFATGKYLYFKDWKRKVNPDNGTSFKEGSFPIPSGWKRIFRRDDPITKNFYDAMYEIKMINPVDYIKQKYNIIGKNPGVLTRVSRQEVYKLFAELGFTKGCEVGVEKGKNAQEMFEYIPNLFLYGVDPYKQHPQYGYEAEAYLRRWDDRYLRMIKRQAQKRLHGKNAILIEKFSEDAARDIPDNSLDFVYIDGDHSYDFVMQDIILWGRKVRKGGIISGHDYFYDNNKPGRQAKVTQAVNDYTKVHGIEFYITGEDKYVKKGDIPPSWLWVKTEEISPNVVGA